MKKIFALLIFLFTFGVHSQTPEKQKETKKSEAKKANFRVQVFKKSGEEEIKLQEADPEFKKRLPISAQVDKNGLVDLKDLPRAANIDSVWKAELLNSDLFETMQAQILEQDYSEVVYKELPTDTLKARLARLNARTPFNVEYHPALIIFQKIPDLPLSPRRRI